MKIAGCWSTREMPTRRAAFAPSTTTRSARREWPASKNRPADSSARTARKRPGEAAFIGSCVAPAASGSLIGTDRTSAPRTSTSASVPAATTPLRRRRRASASHGRTALRAPPARTEGLTTMSVAASASKCPTIWLPAVFDRPSVATSAPTPITVPSTVSATRAGRASRPGDRLADEVARAHPRAGRDGASAAARGLRPRTHVSSVRTAVDHPHPPLRVRGHVLLVGDHDEREARRRRARRRARAPTSVLTESRLPVGSSHSSRLGSASSARAIATRCCSPPDSRVGRKPRAVRHARRARARRARAPRGPGARLPR